MRNLRPGRRGPWWSLALTFTLLAGACSTGDDTTAPAGGAAPDRASTPGPDDADPIEAPPDTTRFDLENGVVIAMAAPPLSLDPHRTQTRGDDIYLSMAYDRLVELSNSLDVVPMLATEWSYASDGSSFDMTLREGVTFHDGTPFDADAVVANIERAKTIEGSVVASSLVRVTSVEAIDPNHVRFNLDGGPTNLPQVLSGLAGTMISPTVIDDPDIDLATDLVDAGGGPYRITDWQQGQYVTYEPAPGYWDPARQRAGGARITFVPDEQAQLDGIATGEFDVIQVNGLAPQAIASGDAGEFRYLPQTNNTVHGLMLNPSMGDLQNADVRHAIMIGIDRNSLVDDVMGGLCENRGQAFPLGSTYFFPDLEGRYRYDPDGARELVEASGIPDPSFEVLAPAGIYQTFAEAMSEQLAEVGITMTVVPSDITESVGAFTQGQAAAVSLATIGYPDPGQLLEQVYFRLGATMFPPGDTSFQERVVAAESFELSGSERIDAYHRIMADIADLAVFIPACSTVTVWAWQPDVVGVDSMPNLWRGTPYPYTIGLVDRG